MQLIRLVPFVFAFGSFLPAARADDRHFETRVRPVLAEHCFTCHGPKKQKGDLRLDTAAGFASGGDTGEPLVNAKEPAKSLLLRAVRHDDITLTMPPKGKLTDTQIADLAQWVKDGAVYPAAKAIADDSTALWSLRPLVDPKLPANAGIDHFILQKLAAKNLALAPAADLRTLLRRVTFDLTGLPPTTAEMDAFLKSALRNPNSALEQMIDRLLASPAYGERWGRHWLDVVRYADSNGLDENIAHGNAWRYRDYVIQAFNDDKPYDRFLKEQIAGDLLPHKTEAERHEHLIATGFVSLGPKVLAEADKKKLEMDLVDEQVDTLGRAVLGLTLGCARCHDHKFDPISIDDYYGLAGIFLSTKTMDSFKTIARWHEYPLGTPTEVKAKADYDAATAKLTASSAALAKAPDAYAKAVGQVLKDSAATREKAAPELPSAMGVTEATVVDAPLMKRGNHLNPGVPVSRRFPKVLAGDSAPSLPKDHSGRLELANWIVRPEHPLTARVIVNRVWRWHFGTGLVASTDNFGRLGDKPSHPELLDWLALRFIDDGWSIKKLHKRILLSATYRQAGVNPNAPEPDNALLARFSPRRLEAEEIRDSLLAVSGRLDRTPGGIAITHVKNREFLFDHTSKDGTKYDSLRRSIYLPVIRNNQYEVFRLFDAADPAVVTGSRATTTVATQTLFWLNSELVLASADSLAGRIHADAALDDAGRVKWLVQHCYARPASDTEVSRYVAALGKFDGELHNRRKAWAAVAQVILAANEFITIK